MYSLGFPCQPHGTGLKVLSWLPLRRFSNYSRNKAWRQVIVHVLLVILHPHVIINYNFYERRSVAQLVEQRSPKPPVRGSSPRTPASDYAEVVE
jgi:hypothetical protein